MGLSRSLSPGRVKEVERPHTVLVMALILAWYALGISLIYVNKIILTTKRFQFPFITVLTTNSLLWLLALVLTCAGVLRPPKINAEIFRRRALPTGICMGLDIGTANWSLQYLNVTFFTMIRGTIPSFVLAFGLFFGLEVVNPTKIFSIITVCIGIGLASVGEVHFHIPGVLMCFGSCAIAGMRWVLVQKMMVPTPNAEEEALRASDGQSGGEAGQGDRAGRMPKEKDEPTTPLGTILLVTPITVVTCVPFAVVFELRTFLSSVWWREATFRRTAIEYLFTVAIIAFLLQLTKYHLVNATSSLSMSVMGICKQLFTIIGAVIIFGDELTIVRSLGFIVCSAGLLAYQQSVSDGPSVFSRWLGARRTGVHNLSDLGTLTGSDVRKLLGFQMRPSRRPNVDDDSIDSETALNMPMDEVGLFSGSSRDNLSSLDVPGKARGVNINRSSSIGL